MITIHDLIAKKDYDYINWRTEIPDTAGSGATMFIGITKSKDGKIIPLDGDNYSENAEVKRYEEWSSENIPNGLTVVI